MYVLVSGPFGKLLIRAQLLKVFLLLFEPFDIFGFWIDDWLKFFHHLNSVPRHIFLAVDLLSYHII